MYTTRAVRNVSHHLKPDGPCWFDEISDHLIDQNRKWSSSGYGGTGSIPVENLICQWLCAFFQSSFCAQLIFACRTTIFLVMVALVAAQNSEPSGDAPSKHTNKLPDPVHEGGLKLFFYLNFPETGHNNMLCRPCPHT